MIATKTFNLFAKSSAEAADWASDKIDPDLRYLVALVAYLLYRSGYPAVLTDVLRDSGIHATGRAADLRVLGINPAVAEAIRTEINKTFPYGLASDGRPRDTIPPFDHKGESMKATANHFHIQVNTRDRRPKWGGAEA